MLKHFPYSFAPSNASIQAKEAAHYVLESDFDQGAVYEGLIKLKEMNLL